MEATQAIPCPREDKRREAITKLIESVAKQQEALAEILEAEHRKIQKTVELSGVDVDDLVALDRSVEQVLAAVTRLELTLPLKPDLFRDCLCPEERRYCCAYPRRKGAGLDPRRMLFIMRVLQSRGSSAMQWPNPAGHRRQSSSESC